MDFSDEFSIIAKNTQKLTEIFYQLDLLGISRKSIEGSLVAGSQLADRKQAENCGRIEKIGVTKNGERLYYTVRSNSEILTRELPLSEAKVFMNALGWVKIFLQKSFPIYKYYGQKIMPVIFCFNSSLTKITQVQSSLAIDPKMAEATQKVAAAEVNVYKLRSELIRAAELGADPHSSHLEGIQRAVIELELAQQEFKIRSFTPLETVLNPKILREYNISFD